MRKYTWLLAFLVLGPAERALGARPGTPTPGVPASDSAPVAVGFQLAPLPYPADALEPAIDATTMALHHGKHHQAYVTNLNAAIAADPALANLSLDELVARAGALPPIVRNNAGGHWNHTFFWASMAPPSKTRQPSPELRAAIEASFGSFDAFKAAFKEAGLKRFGSGWVWLVVGADGKLVVSSTPNQDNPRMDLAEVRGVPLLGNDLWEHAYYLKYQNRRGEYLDAWWSVVDWGVVSERYATVRGDPR